jgi:hypothetical protein
VAIAGQARVIGHDGVTGLGDSIEQGGFAHIGAPHDGDDWFQGVSLPLKAVGRPTDGRCGSG